MPRGRLHLAGNVESVDGSRSDPGCPGDCSETSRVAPLQPLTILLPFSVPVPSQLSTSVCGNSSAGVTSLPLLLWTLFSCFISSFSSPHTSGVCGNRPLGPPVSCPHSPLLLCCLLSEMPFLPRVFLLIIQGLAQKPFPRDCLRLLASPSAGTWCETWFHDSTLSFLPLQESEISVSRVGLTPRVCVIQWLLDGELIFGFSNLVVYVWNLVLEGLTAVYCLWTGYKTPRGELV